MEIKTNKHWRNFLYGHELPQKVIDSEFDYVDADDLPGRSFIKYKGQYYDLGDIMTLQHGRESYPEQFKGWHAYISETFFSGILVRISDDGEQYQVATYFS